jgi:Tfp pilus assembly protein PilW
MAVTHQGERGCGVAELLLGVVLALVVLAGLLGALAAGSAALARAGRRTEASDTLQLTTEALLFDLRRAGFDPRGDRGPGGAAPSARSRARRGRSLAVQPSVPVRTRARKMSSSQRCPVRSASSS